MKIGKLAKNKFIWLYACLIMYSFTSVAAKKAALSKPFGVTFFLYIGAEMILLMLYALLWQQVLKKFSVVTAMSHKSIIVIINLIWAVVFFGESVSRQNIIGAVIIVAGILVISQNE